MVSDRFLRSVIGPGRVLALGADLIRGACWLAAALVGFGSMTIVLPASWRLVSSIHFNDFGRFYYATELFKRGSDMYGLTPATPVRMPPNGVVQLLDLNPPHFHAIVVPLTGLPIETAFLVWSLAGLACLICSLALMQRELRAGWSAAGLMWTFLWIVASAASETTFVTGQMTFFLMLPVTLAWLAARRGAWRRAAWLLGILASVKPFLGVFVFYFLVRRRWRLSLHMAIACLLTVGLGVATFGLPSYLSWTHALSSVVWPWLPMNASVGGLLSRVLDGGPVFVPVLRLPAAVRTATAIASITLFFATLRQVAVDDRPGAIDRSFLRLLLVAILISPLGWVYYLWIAAGPAVSTWLAERESLSGLRSWLVLLAMVGLFVPIGLTLKWTSQPWSSVAIGSIYTWSTLLLWTAAISGSGPGIPAPAAKAPGITLS